MSKRKYINLVPYIRAAQNGDDDALNFLLERFDPLLRGQAMYGRRMLDDDRLQELKLFFTKIVQQFDIDFFMNER